MAKERRARLAPLPAPTVVSDAAVAVAGEASAPAVVAAPRRARRDVRSTEHVAALYARVPAKTKRRLDIATAMVGCNLSDVLTALLDAHVDPNDPEKQSALAQLLGR